jgi:ankyrin repeat protein
MTSDTTTNIWFQAAETGDLATLRAMIVDGFNVETRDDQERTAFHIASQNSQTDVMTTLLAARQMNYLRRLGVDPFSVPLSDDVDIANQNRQRRT